MTQIATPKPDPEVKICQAERQSAPFDPNDPLAFQIAMKQVERDVYDCVSDPD